MNRSFGSNIVSALILAGGFSKRMGRDKARVKWQGLSLLDHVIARTSSLASEQILVVREDQLAQEWPLTHVVTDDSSLPAGPLRGIIAGLEAASCPISLVIGCDSPLVVSGLLVQLQTRLLSLPAAVNAVVPVWAGYPQPLLAAYRSNSAAQLRALCSQGEQSIRDALRHIGQVEITEDECRHYDPSGLSFANVNTEDDLTSLSAHLKSSALRC